MQAGRLPPPGAPPAAALAANAAASKVDLPPELVDEEIGAALRMTWKQPDELTPAAMVNNLSGPNAQMHLPKGVIQKIDTKLAPYHPLVLSGRYHVYRVKAKYPTPGGAILEDYRRRDNIGADAAKTADTASALRARIDHEATLKAVSAAEYVHVEAAGAPSGLINDRMTMKQESLQQRLSTWMDFTRVGMDLAMTKDYFVFDMIAKRQYLDLKKLVETYEVAIDAAEPSNGTTCLMMAASCGFYDVVELFVVNGANVNKQTLTGSTALHHVWDSWIDRLAKGGWETRAAKEDHLKSMSQMVKLLLKNGADPNLVTADNETALHLAAQYDHGGIAHLLIRGDVDLERARKRDGLTAAQVAQKYGSEDASVVIANGYLLKRMRRVTNLKQQMVEVQAAKAGGAAAAEAFAMRDLKDTTVGKGSDAAKLGGGAGGKGPAPGPSRVPRGPPIVTDKPSSGTELFKQVADNAKAIAERNKLIGLSPRGELGAVDVFKGHAAGLPSVRDVSEGKMGSQELIERWRLYEHWLRSRQLTAIAEEEAKGVVPRFNIAEYDPTTAEVKRLDLVKVAEEAGDTLYATRAKAVLANDAEATGWMQTRNLAAMQLGRGAGYLTGRVAVGKVPEIDGDGRRVQGMKRYKDRRRQLTEDEAERASVVADGDSDCADSYDRVSANGDSEEDEEWERNEIRHRRMDAGLPPEITPAHAQHRLALAATSRAINAAGGQDLLEDAGLLDEDENEPIFTLDQPVPGDPLSMAAARVDTQDLPAVAAASGGARHMLLDKALASPGGAPPPSRGGRSSPNRYLLSNGPVSPGSTGGRSGSPGPSPPPPHTRTKMLMDAAIAGRPSVSLATTVPSASLVLAEIPSVPVRKPFVDDEAEARNAAAGAGRKKPFKKSGPHTAAEEAFAEVAAGGLGHSTSMLRAALSPLKTTAASLPLTLPLIGGGHTAQPTGDASALVPWHAHVASQLSSALMESGSVNWSRPGTASTKPGTAAGARGGGRGGGGGAGAAGASPGAPQVSFLSGLSEARPKTEKELKLEASMQQLKDLRSPPANFDRGEHLMSDKRVRRRFYNEAVFTGMKGTELHATGGAATVPGLEPPPVHSPWAPPVLPPNLDAVATGPGARRARRRSEDDEDDDDDGGPKSPTVAPSSLAARRARVAVAVVQDAPGADYSTSFTHLVNGQIYTRRPALLSSTLTPSRYRLDNRSSVAGLGRAHAAPLKGLVLAGAGDDGEPASRLVGARHRQNDGGKGAVATGTGTATGGSGFGSGGGGH